MVTMTWTATVWTVARDHLWTETTPVTMAMVSTRAPIQIDMVSCRQEGMVAAMGCGRGRANSSSSIIVSIIITCHTGNNRTRSHPLTMVTTAAMWQTTIRPAGELPEIPLT